MLILINLIGVEEVSIPTFKIFSTKIFAEPSRIGNSWELISTIKKNLILSNPVLIHCNGGKGRSGMIAALVLKAMKEKDTVKKVRDNVVGAIETEEQESFVENWI